MVKAGDLFRDAMERFFEGRTVISKADSYIMKKVNGSECTCDVQGQITALKDAEGRTWLFGYMHKQLLQFTDPQNNTWVMQDGKWQAKAVTPGFATPKAVAINHATGEIRVEDNVRLTVYLPDGSTQIEVTQIMDGVPVPVRFTEFATHPHRSFVVMEQHHGADLVTWIQDAQCKLFKLEYESGKLIRYIDMSTKPATVWNAVYINGVISSWDGHLKGSGQSVGNMQPVLQSVDLNGNRNYKSVSGQHVIVDPSGKAFSARAEDAPAASAFNAAFSSHPVNQ